MLTLTLTCMCSNDRGRHCRYRSHDRHSGVSPGEVAVGSKSGAKRAQDILVDI